jgi:rhodanese-related sulfurtransferase
MDMTQQGFAQRLVELYEAHPNRPMAIICASGARSTYVVTALRERGLKRLVNIREGMTGGRNGPGWLAKNLPVRSIDQPIQN